MNECIRRWESAEELYLSLVNKEPFEQLKDKITAYINEEKKKSQKNILKAIYHMSMAVSDEDTFDKVYMYLKQYGINYEFFDTTADYYHVYKFLSHNESDKYIVFNHQDNILFPFTIPLIIIDAVNNYSVEELRTITHRVENKLRTFCGDIDEYIYYLATKGKNELVIKICQAYGGIGLAAALNIAIGYPDLFYGSLQEKCFNNLHAVFRYRNRIRKIEEVIPFMFRSKGFNKYPYCTKTACIDNILLLHNTITNENMKKISGYIPKVRTMSVSDMIYLMQKRNSRPEYLETVLDKIDRQITFTGKIYTFYENAESTIIDFCDNYLNCKIYIDYTLLHNILDNEPKMLDCFLDKGAELKITSEERHSLIKFVINKNDVDAVKQLVKTDLLNSENWEEAIEYAVESNALKALNMLNEQFPLVCGIHSDTH